MSARDRAILAVVCVVAAIVAPWILVIQPKRDQAAKLQAQISKEQSQLSGVQAQIAQGNAAKAAFASSYATLVRLGEAVPTDDNTTSLIYELQSAAQGSRVDFLGLTYNAGQATSSSTAAPTTSTTASTATLPPGATVGAAGFPVEPFTFTFQGSFFDLAGFLGHLQKFVVANNNDVSVSGRLMTLNAITLGPGGKGFPEVLATISAYTYLLPASQGLLNGATPSGPSTSSTQTVSSKSSTSAAPAAVVTAPTLR